MQKRRKTVAVAALGAGLALATTLSGCNGTSSQSTSTHHPASTTHVHSNSSNVTPPSISGSNGAPTGSITTR